MLASHWPCVTDNSGLSTYGHNGLRKGDEQPAYAPSGLWPFFTFTTFVSMSVLQCLLQSQSYEKTVKADR